MIRYPSSIPCILVATALPCAVGAQAAQSTHVFQIEQGPLGAAIARLGRQGKVVIVADPALLRARKTAGVRGRFTPADALAHVLAGTGLVAQSDGDGGFTLADRSESVSDAADAEDILVLADRAVSATKTDTAIAKTPQAISVITGEQIAARGATGVQEALRYTPGLRPESNGVDNRFDYVTARGGFVAAQFVDGMRRPDISAAPRTDVYNLERIEALRGPSSVLYGQAAAGGIINTISKRPEFDTAAAVAVQYGSFDRKQTQAELTGALNADDTLAARIVGVVRDADSQVDYSRDDRIMIAPSLRFRPSDVTDITLLGLYQRDRASGATASYQPIIATVNAPKGQRLSRTAFFGEPAVDYYNTEEKSGTLLVTHRFSDAVRYNGAVRYSRYEQDSDSVDLAVWYGLENPFIDEDNRVLPRTRFGWRSRVKMLTTDNNLAFDFATGPFVHKILVGVDYLRSSSKTAYIYTDVDPIDIYAPVYTGVPDGEFVPNPHEVASQLGVYFQDQISYADRVTLVLGARRDRAKSTTDGIDPIVDKATTFRVGLIGDAGSGIAPYVSYSESFQPTLGLDVNGQRYLPQRGVQYEIGVKWQPNRALLASIAGFKVKGTNRQQTDPTDVNNLIQQGEVKSKGVEVELAWTVARDFSLSFSYAYIDAKLSKSGNPREIGTPIQAVAKNTVSAWGEKRFELGEDAALRLGAGVRYVGPSFETQTFYDVDPLGFVDLQRTPAYTLVDALVALDWKQWSLSVNATNLFDKTYYASCSVRSACGVGYARNVMGTLGYKF